MKKKTSHGGSSRKPRVVSDTTKRMKAEHAFRESERKYRRLFEAAQDGILLVDHQTGKILDVNPFLTKLLGYSRMSFLKKYLWEIGAFKDIVASKKNFRILQARKYIRYEDLPLEAKGGKKIEVEFVSNVYKVNGVKTIQCNIRDVTDRKGLERKIFAILASIGDAVIACDRDGTIVLFNKVAENLTGISSKKAIDRNFQDVMKFATENEGPCHDWITEAIEKNRITKMPDNVVLMRKDGRKIPVADSAVPLKDVKGNPAGFTMVFRDVTKERGIEKARSEFISLASHQLRTPLTEIRWALSSLKQERLTDEQMLTVETAHKATGHMAETIKSMLIISHIETGEINPEPVNIDLQKTIEDVVHLYDAMRNTQKITLKIRCPERIRVHADEQLLKEILSNLLTNAYKYTPKEGNVRISVIKLKNRVRIDIADTGFGIPRGEQKRVSEKFFRGSNIVDKAEEGSGIGLNMVYSLVNLLEGTIAFTSKEKKGTTFSLTLPSSSV